MHGVLQFIFFKVTWPLKPEPLGQSRTFVGNNEIWGEVYQNLIQKEYSQKDHSLSTTGNLSSTNVPPMLSFYNSPECFSHLPHSLLSLAVHHKHTPWHTWGKNTHKTCPASSSGRYTSLPAFLAPGQTGQTSFWASCCTGCCLLKSVFLPFGIPALYAWRNCEITANNKLNIGQQCHNIAIKLISFWIA